MDQYGPPQQQPLPPNLPISPIPSLRNQLAALIMQGQQAAQLAAQRRQQRQQPFPPQPAQQSPMPGMSAQQMGATGT